MNHEIEFTRFAFQVFNLFLKKKKNVSSAGLLQTRNKIQGICHYNFKQATLAFSPL